MWNVFNPYYNFDEEEQYSKRPHIGNFYNNPNNAESKLGLTNGVNYGLGLGGTFQSGNQFDSGNQSSNEDLVAVGNQFGSGDQSIGTSKAQQGMSKMMPIAGMISDAIPKINVGSIITASANLTDRYNQQQKEANNAKKRRLGMQYDAIQPYTPYGIESSMLADYGAEIPLPELESEGTPVNFSGSQNPYSVNSHVSQLTPEQVQMLQMQQMQQAQQQGVLPDGTNMQRPQYYNSNQQPAYTTSEVHPETQEETLESTYNPPVLTELASQSLGYPYLQFNYNQNSQPVGALPQQSPTMPPTVQSTNTSNSTGASTSSDQKDDISQQEIDQMSFGKAFRHFRNKLGANKTFIWKNVRFNTNFEGEKGNSKKSGATNNSSTPSTSSSSTPSVEARIREIESATHIDEGTKKAYAEGLRAGYIQPGEVLSRYMGKADRAVSKDQSIQRGVDWYNKNTKVFEKPKGGLTSFYENKKNTPVNENYDKPNLFDGYLSNTKYYNPEKKFGQGQPTADDYKYRNHLRNVIKNGKGLVAVFEGKDFYTKEYSTLTPKQKAEVRNQSNKLGSWKPYNTKK